MTVNEAIREYLLDCESRNLSEETLRWYREKLSGFRSFLAETGITEIDQVSARTIREFMVWKRGQKPKTGCNDILSGNTLAGFDQVLRSFFGFLVREEYIAANHTEKLKKVKRPKLWSCPDLVDSEQILRREQLINLPGCLEPLLFEVLRAQITQR